MISQAFVLGAGLGRRLRPLTDDLPKPLVPVFQKPLITFALDHLTAAGVKSFVINTHYLPAEFEMFFAAGNYRQLPVRLVHEPVLLETGGGMKNAQPFMSSQPFLVYSGDLLTDIALEPLIEEHLRSGNDVTLALRETGLAAQIALRDGRVLDIGNRRGHPGSLDYANVSVWSPQAFSRFSLGEKISFIPVLAKWIGEGGRIGGVILNEGRWFNLASAAQYLEIHRAIAQEHWRPRYAQPPDWPVRIAPDAVIEEGAEMIGFVSVGARCRVASGARVEDSILWPGARIASRTQLKRCIVRAHRAAEGVLSDVVI